MQPAWPRRPSSLVRASCSPWRSGARRALPNATPAGLGPAQLRDAYKLTSNGSSSITIAVVEAFYRDMAAQLRRAAQPR